MKLKEFFDLIKTRPIDDELRLYCPTNQDYYYIESTSIMLGRIIYLTNNKNKRSFSTYKSILWHLDHLGPLMNEEIKFYHQDQEFIIP
jgi:hypothetical protein